MKIIGIIPARYASTRLPGKPLAYIGNKSMIQRVYEQAKKATLISTVTVATDNTEIYDHVQNFGGEVCMTREDHPSGTDRCYEALFIQPQPYDYVINIQGDEPFIKPEQIDLLASKLDGHLEIATLIKKIETYAQYIDRNAVKVIIDEKFKALNFTRNSALTPFEHVGLYAYRSDILNYIVNLPVSEREKLESLEQLRWIRKEISILCVETTESSFSINTQDDLQKAIEIINS